MADREVKRWIQPMCAFVDMHVIQQVSNPASIGQPEVFVDAHDYDTLNAECKRLREENRELRAEIEMLRIDEQDIPSKALADQPTDGDTVCRWECIGVEFTVDAPFRRYRVGCKPNTIRAFEDAFPDVLKGHDINYCQHCGKPIQIESTGERGER